MGNASGMDSDAELHAEANLAIVGIGWQLNNIPSNHSRLEMYELEEARRLKQLKPGLKVMLTRETQATTTLYTAVKKKMLDPRCKNWWVQCGDAPCRGKWYSPAGNTLKYWFNYSNPELVEWWLNEFIAVPLANPLVDGLYFDSAPDDAPPDDGRGQGGGPDRRDAQAAFDRALAVIASKGKWASAWNNDGQSLFPRQGIRPDANPSYFGPDSCSNLVKEWIILGKRPENTLQVQIGTNSPSNATIAAFLIARGASAVLEYPLNLGTYTIATDPKQTLGWPSLMRVDFGRPVADGSEVHPGIFQRKWTKATVTLDCATLNSTFEFAARSNHPYIG